MVPGRLALAAALAAAGLLVAPAPARDNPPAAAVVPQTFAVEKKADIAYRDGPTADPERHKLDLYLPKAATNFPVVMFVHGGTWRSGNKDMYAALGHAFAKAGIGTVIANYRLSPKVKHPAHVEDVAGAFAWTHANLGKYGGDAKRVFLFGHSAGGHLVSLLATDPAYLAAEKLTPADIRGVVAVSGVYKIYHEVALFHSSFGDDAKVCLRASPLSNVSGKHPPFLIAYGDKDFPNLDAMAVDMNAALEKAKCPTTLLKLRDRNHYTIITGVIDPADPLHRAIREFVAAAAAAE